MTLPKLLRILLAAGAALAPLWLPAPARALAPDEVLVVANRNSPGSLELAAYYAKRRAIPPANVLKLLVTESEACSREEYDERIAKPVLERLRAGGGKALRAVVLMRGVPLRVLPPSPSPEDQSAILRLTFEERALSGATGEEEKARVGKRRAELQKEIEALRRTDEEASVDSELTLVKVPGHERKRWIPNPLFLGATGRTDGVRPDDVMRVSRLDGPSEAIVRRVVDDSLAAEAAGLKGSAYLDARWKDPGDDKPLSGYALWDKSIHRAAAALRRAGLTVVLDDAEALFPAGSRLPAALYCGWYSLMKYVPAFDWQKGAVAYHIASGECATLRAGDSQGWCKRLLEEGVAATLGPVSEPYVQAFPPPHLFLPLLVEAHLALAEAYILSVPSLSWKMVLVGDPLYRPFPGP